MSVHATRQSSPRNQEDIFQLETLAWRSDLNQDDFYKRQADQKWREKIDERILILTTSLNGINDQIDEIQERLKDIDDILRGDAKQDIGGLMQRLHLVETKVSSISAAIFADMHGRGGLVNDVADLKEGRLDLREEASNKWKFWTAVVVACITTTGFLIKMWPDIRGIFIDDGKTAYQHLTQPKILKKPTRNKAPKHYIDDDQTGN